MRDLHRLLGTLSIVLVALVAVTGLTGHPSIAFHATLGLIAVIAIAAVQSLLFIYTIGTGKSMAAAAAAGSMEPELLAQAMRLKKTIMGPLHNLCFLGVAVAILGGAADTAHIAPWIHGVVAALFVGMVIRTYRSHDTTLAALGRIIEEARLKAGRDSLYDFLEDAESRASNDSAQAIDARGQKVLFLAGTVWIAYVYMRFVCMSPGVPWWPFAIAFVAMTLWGVWLKGKGRRAVAIGMDAGITRAATGDGPCPQAPPSPTPAAQEPRQGG